MALKGLDKIKKRVEEKTNFGDGESPFLTIKDGESVVIRFIQELDESSPLYDERRGTIVVVEEHTSPKDFKLRGVCSEEDEGRCFPCENYNSTEVGKKWKSRLRFYANVIVRGADGNDKVKVLAQGFGDKNIGKSLLDYAEEYDGLGGMDFKLVRSGSTMNDTSYRLLPKAPKALSEEDKALEVKDLTKFVKYISYKDQADFYAGVEVTKPVTEEWLSE